MSLPRLVVGAVVFLAGPALGGEHGGDQKGRDEASDKLASTLQDYAAGSRESSLPVEQPGSSELQRTGPFYPWLAGTCGPAHELTRGEWKAELCGLVLSVSDDVKVSRRDWTNDPFAWSRLLRPVAALLLSLAVHRRSLGSSPGVEDVETPSPRKPTRYTQIAQLALTAVAFGPGASLGPGWVAAQLPLVFAALGLCVSFVKEPTARLFAPLIACYGVTIGMNVCCSFTTDHTLIPKLIPFQFLSSMPPEGASLTAAAFASSLACVLLTPALKSITRGSGATAVLYVWLLALLESGVGVERGSSLLRSLGGEAIISLVARLQLPAFACGLAAGGWRQPSRAEQVAGVVFLLWYTVLPLVVRVPPDVLNSMYHGLALPVQLLMVWAAMPLLSFGQAQECEDECDVPGYGVCGSRLTVSFAGILVLPIIASSGLPQLLGLAVCLCVGSCLHLAEFVAWLMAERVSKPAVAATAENSAMPGALLPQCTGAPNTTFLGMWADDAQRSSKNIAQATFFAILLAVWGVSAYETERLNNECTLLQLCIPHQVLYGSPVVLAIVWFNFANAAIPMLLNLFGQLWWPAPVRKPVPSADELMEEAQRNGEDLVMVFRYCTRGKNPSLVRSNVLLANEALIDSGICVDSWRIEVVTDFALGLQSSLPDLPVVETVVPAGYCCPNGGKFKARALHYAIHHSPLQARGVDWIVHLDEETRFDGHTVCAIYQHCVTQNKRVKALAQEGSLRTIMPDCGQGAILYNTNGVKLEAHLTAFTDLARVGDDFGKFRICFEGLGRAAIGMHGSYAVINQAVEAAVGFDHGEVASITEDSYFALQAHANFQVGVQWIDAFMFEQSPFTATDLIRQRARWFHGLFHCTLLGKNQMPFRSCWIMTAFVNSWWFLWLFFIIKVVYKMDSQGGGYLASSLYALGEMFSYHYAFGFSMNFSPYREGIGRWICMFFMQGSMLLAISCLELGGVIYGIYLVATDASEFYIVQKEKELEQGACTECKKDTTTSQAAVDLEMVG